MHRALRMDDTQIMKIHKKKNTVLIINAMKITLHSTKINKSTHIELGQR